MALKVVFSNERGSYPSDKIVNFCGLRVIDELMKKPFEYNGRMTRQIRVNFEKKGRLYYVLKSKNEKKGEFTFHVYEYIE